MYQHVPLLVTQLIRLQRTISCLKRAEKSLYWEHIRICYLSHLLHAVIGVDLQQKLTDHQWCWTNLHVKFSSATAAERTTKKNSFSTRKNAKDLLTTVQNIMEHPLLHLTKDWMLIKTGRGSSCFRHSAKRVSTKYGPTWICTESRTWWPLLGNQCPK